VLLFLRFCFAFAAPVAVRGPSQPLPQHPFPKKNHTQAEKQKKNGKIIRFAARCPEAVSGMLPGDSA